MAIDTSAPYKPAGVCSETVSRWWKWQNEMPKASHSMKPEQEPGTKVSVARYVKARPKEAQGIARRMYRYGGGAPAAKAR